MPSRFALSFCACIALAACSRSVDVDDVPVGTDVALTREDGGVVQGKLAARDDKAVVVDTGRTTRSVPREQIADVQPVEAGKPVDLPASARFREHTVPAGAELALEIETPVNTGSSRVSETVRATLARPVQVGEVLVLPAGASVVGEITAIRPAGKVKGRASVTIAFNRIEAAGNSYPINARFGAVAPSTRGEDAKRSASPPPAAPSSAAFSAGRRVRRSAPRSGAAPARRRSC